jgi:hypothetical protein
MHNLPAALVLLQETGESSLVVELGSSWLQQHANEPFAPDVATSVALAHCDEAAAALDASGGTVVLQACRHLETALQLLREFKMAANLQHLIMQTLEVRVLDKNELESQTPTCKCSQQQVGHDCSADQFTPKIVTQPDKGLCLQHACC